MGSHNIANEDPVQTQAAPLMFPLRGSFISFAGDWRVFDPSKIHLSDRVSVSVYNGSKCFNDIELDSSILSCCEKRPMNEPGARCLPILPAYLRSSVSDCQKFVPRTCFLSRSSSAYQEKDPRLAIICISVEYA